MLPGAIARGRMIRDFVLYVLVIGGAVAAVVPMVINTGQLVGWW